MDRKKLKPEERLIVAADFKPTEPDQGVIWIEYKVRELTASLKGTGVYLKINSALRGVGQNLIPAIHSYGLKVFADLKLCDIPETLGTDGAFLRGVKPELLTVMCAAGGKSMNSLKNELPMTEVLGVTVLTSIKQADLPELGYPKLTSLDVVVRAMAETALVSGIGGIICSPSEATMIREVVGNKLTINTPAIRPTWAIVPGDDQNPERIMTPAKAIMAGADRIVVGRPIIQAKNPYDAVMRTIEEIDEAMKLNTF